MCKLAEKCTNETPTYVMQFGLFSHIHTFSGPKAPHWSGTIGSILNEEAKQGAGGVQWPQASNLGWPLFQTCRPTWFILRSDDRSWYKCFASCDLSVPSTPASVVISCPDTWMAGIRSVDILTTLTFTELRLSLSMIYYGLSQ